MEANNKRSLRKQRLLQDITELETLLQSASVNPDNPETAMAVAIIAQHLKEEKELLQSFD